MIPADISDCVQRAREGTITLEARHAAFEELVRSFEAMALGSATRMLLDIDEARDASQDAFLSAWLKLGQLRFPAAFGSWFKRLVSTECHRRLRKRRTLTQRHEPRAIPESAGMQDPDWSLLHAVPGLTEAERHALELFYVHGSSIDEIAAMLGAPPPTIGKRLYAVRLKIRRSLPSSVRLAALRIRAHGKRLKPDALTDFVGTYRFEARPELVVEIQRSPCGDFLVSRGRGHADALQYIGDDTLATQSFDGEGCFQRDERGCITQFIYYEFGVRLGVARKVAPIARA